MRRRFPLPGATLAGITAVIAACGAGAGGDPVGQAAGDAPAATSAAGRDDALLEFVRCMRREGIDMPDPEEGPGGGFVSFRHEFGAPSQAEFLAAQAACRRHLEAAGLAHDPPDEAELARREEQLLAFARCMRSEGIPMPDPQLGPGGSTTFQFPMGGLPEGDIDAIQRRCAERAGMEAPVMVAGARP